MIKYTPTTEQMREWFSEPQTEAEAMSIDAHYENAEAFDRWLAEVERAAAEKALTEIRGIIAGQGWQPLWFFDKAVESYRRNEGEKA
ncbi:hypothetical protein [Leucobacter sp. 1207-22]|uniref:hypothetical protein n=1 Tax=Leucobacter sp. 1207-22 TaxID=2604456 RepID=UPI004063B31C